MLCFINVLCGADFDYTYTHRTPIKIVGHQWYWEVSQEVFKGVRWGMEQFDSLMTDFISSVDKPIILERGKTYQLLVTSADVIHSFSSVGMGVKIDACPGRVNSVSIRSKEVGCFVGYCTELCGAGHAYMPIVFECVKKLSTPQKI